MVVAMLRLTLIAILCLTASAGLGRSVRSIVCSLHGYIVKKKVFVCCILYAVYCMLYAVDTE